MPVIEHPRAERLLHDVKRAKRLLVVVVKCGRLARKQKNKNVVNKMIRFKPMQSVYAVNSLSDGKTKFYKKKPNPTA